MLIGDGFAYQITTRISEAIQNEVFLDDVKCVSRSIWDIARNN